MRPHRLVLLTILTLLISMLTLDVGAAVAAPKKPKKPEVSRVLKAEGPLEAARVTLVGRHLRGVRRVTFGGARASSITRRGNRLTVTAPARRKAGRVAVRVQTRAGWSRISGASHYTYRAAPRVTGVVPSSGAFAGGDRVTVRGVGFTRATAVTFGSTPGRIVRSTDGAVTVTTPAGVLGKTPVRVITTGGRSVTNVPFEYVLPADSQESELAAADEVVLASGVAWVTGGNPVDGPRAGVLDPWIVGLVSGASSPRLGARYYLPPGGAVQPAGLAGRVTAVAAQRDGTVRLTIRPDDLNEIFDHFDGSFSGPLGDLAVDRQARRAGSRESKFAISGAGPFDCSNDDDTLAAPIQSSLSFGLENIHFTEEHEFGAFRTPSLDVALTGDLVVGGSISAQGSVSCSLKASWANANRKPFALPIPGLTLSFGPTAGITVTGSGTWSFEKRTQVTIAVSYQFGDPTPTATRVIRETSTKTSASASISVDAAFGISAQLAVLDRAGIELRAQVGFKGDITVSTPPPRACVGGELYAKASIGLFLDLWVKRWTFDVAELRVRLLRLELCTDTAESLAASDTPEIVSLRMPDGALGQEYDERLGTRDHRGGTWSANRMPTGLSLNASNGRITGTPTGGVGEQSLVVRFADTAGRTAVATVRLYLFPAQGLEGGDVQITLTWDSAADLDLHVNDPRGEDIWYGNKVSDSGGVLDYDANAGCGEVQDQPTENIHWPYDEAPDGRYDLSVVTYSNCGTDDLDWTLTMRFNGAVVLLEDDYGDSVEYYVTIEDGDVVDVGILDRPPVQPARRPKA